MTFLKSGPRPHKAHFLGFVALPQSHVRRCIRFEFALCVTSSVCSQMFFTFDTVLLLSGGRVAYYGAPRDVLNDFALLGYSCDASQYNPADFIRE